MRSIGCLWIHLVKMLHRIPYAITQDVVSCIAYKEPVLSEGFHEKTAGRTAGSRTFFRTCITDSHLIGRRAEARLCDDKGYCGGIGSEPGTGYALWRDHAS